VLWRDVDLFTKTKPSIMMMVMRLLLLLVYIVPPDTAVMRLMFDMQSSHVERPQRGPNRIVCAARVLQLIAYFAVFFDTWPYML